MQVNDYLYCCKLCDGSGNFEPLAEWLEALELNFSSWENRETGEIYHTVYAETPEQGHANFERLSALLPEWEACGFRVAPPEEFTLKKEDWAEVWKKYFKVLPITGRLVVKPSWLSCEPRPGQVILELDPGMSFGTGQHATTAFCLEVIDQFAGAPGVTRLLDAGCGSGILAIAGALLGYREIDAFDFDPDAVMVARETAGKYRVADKIRIFEADAATWRAERPYDLAAVNILGHLLIKFRHNIARWVRPGGHLALAGILNGEFDAVAAAFGELGFEELARKSRREWTGGLFRKGAAD